MSEKIIVFGRDYSDVDTGDDADVERGWLFSRPAELRYGAHMVSVDELKERLTTFLQRMDSVISNLPAVMGDFSVESVEIAVEVSAKGSVSLLGTGGEVSGTGGLRFTLKRQLRAETH